MLIGYHLLYVLLEELADSPTVANITARLGTYGYRDDQVRYALEYYDGYLIKFVSYEDSKRIRVVFRQLRI